MHKTIMSVKPEGGLQAGVVAAAEDVLSGFCWDAYEAGERLTEVVSGRRDVNDVSLDSRNTEWDVTVEVWHCTADIGERWTLHMDRPAGLTSCDLTALPLDGMDVISCSATLLTSKLLNSVPFCKNDQLLQLRSASLSSKKLSPHTGREFRDFTVEEFLLLTPDMDAAGSVKLPERGVVSCALGEALGRDNLPKTGVISGMPGEILLTAGVFTHLNELLLLRSKSSFIAFLQQHIMNNISQNIYPQISDAC